MARLRPFRIVGVSIVILIIELSVADVRTGIDDLKKAFEIHQEVAALRTALQSAIHADQILRMSTVRDARIDSRERTDGNLGLSGDVRRIFELGFAWHPRLWGDPHGDSVKHLSLTAKVRVAVRRYWRCLPVRQLPVME